MHLHCLTSSFGVPNERELPPCRVACVCAVITTTEDGTRAKFNYKRELTRAQLDIVHIRHRQNEILVSNGSATR